METQAATNQKRGAALMSVLLGAAASLGLMLWVGRHNKSLLLVLIFTVWVASPFAGLLWVHSNAKRREVSRQRSTYGLMLLISLGSIAVYAAAIFLMHLAKPAAPFLVVPAVSWVLVAILLGRADSNLNAAGK
jgi:tryptophan-rich sensory protein